MLKIKSFSFKFINLLIIITYSFGKNKEMIAIYQGRNFPNRELVLFMKKPIKGSVKASHILAEKRIIETCVGRIFEKKNRKHLCFLIF